MDFVQRNERKQKKKGAVRRPDTFAFIGGEGWVDVLLYAAIWIVVPSGIQLCLVVQQSFFLGGGNTNNFQLTGLRVPHHHCPTAGHAARLPVRQVEASTSHF